MLQILLLAVLAAQTTGTGVQRLPTPAELKVVVAAPVYQPDGGLNAETTTLPSGDPTVVHIYSRKSVCETAVTGAAEPKDASFGWRLATKTVSVADSVVNVSVDWRRIWEGGRKLTNGPSGTVQLKLHPGDRIPLDHIPNPAATDACRAVGLGLEVRLARTAPTAPVNSALIPLGAEAGGATPLLAELWLVQRTPSGVEKAHHQTVRLDRNGGIFSFAPIKISGERGEVDVEFGGSFQRYRAPVGGEFLYLSLTRAITGESMQPGGRQDGTATMIPLPGPNDVVSLEIPGFGGGTARGRGGVGIPRGGGGGGFFAPSQPDPAAGRREQPVVATAQAQQRGGAGGARGGRGGGGGGAVAPAGPSGLSPVALEIMKGHAFSLRLKVTPVALPGM